ncbi:MAG: hypothetical protein RM347_010145 [Nostoc sp. ChiQUE02]|nr:hypothetical protein [Nostoc sp. ChiQUE02]MDZ8229168.1 hypothetical protein [Nostoc sp. ChiQUE02]
MGNYELFGANLSKSNLRVGITDGEFLVTKSPLIAQGWRSLQNNWEIIKT